MVYSYIYKSLLLWEKNPSARPLNLQFVSVLFGINLLFIFVLYLFENLIGMPLFQHAVQDDAEDLFKNLGLFLIFAGIFTPVVEELVFRYHLVGYDYRRTITSFLLALPFFILVFNQWGIGDFINLTYVIYLMMMSVLLYINKSTLSKPLILCSIMFFGLSHLSNFQVDEIRENFVFIPILILPQLVLGIFLSFLRIKFGLIYAIIYHAVYNMVLIFVAYFLYLLTGKVF